MHSYMLVATAATLLTTFVSAQGIAGKCTGQSCYVASLSMSTEEPYKLNGKKPGGGNAGGDACIKKWYKQAGLPPPQGLKRFTEGKYTSTDAYADVMNAAGVMNARRSLGRRAAVPKEEAVAVEQTQQAKQAGTSEQADTCTPWILLYARGTTEAGELGATVGPSLKSGLRSDSKWSVRGITSSDGYAADLPGIYCIGLTGGNACKKVLTSMAAKCPTSNFVTSGYSQGAMVARECVAFADEATRARVKGILTYGDPFNGATVKGFDQSKIKVNCNPTDGVCKGDFSIGVGHLSYSTSVGITWLKNLSKSD